MTSRCDETGNGDSLVEKLMRQLGIETEEEFWRKLDHEPAQEWFERYKDALRQEHPGKYLLLNAEDLTYAIGIGHDDAHKRYVEFYGPTPRLGRHFVGQRL